MNTHDFKPWPKVVYKYCPYESLYVEALLTDAIWFSSRDKFNDTYDSNLDVYDDYGADTMGFISKAEQILSIYPAISKKFNSNLLNELKITGEMGARVALCREMSEVMKMATSMCGLACFSSSPTSSLVWAHYANKHKGFCVGREVQASDKMWNEKVSLFDVVYSDRPAYLNFSEYPIDDDSEGGRAFMRDMFRIKNIDWAYEKEWRFIAPRKTNLSIDLGLRVSEIYFGLLMPQWQKESLMHILRNQLHTINYFNVSRVEGSWDLLPTPYRL